MKRKNGFTLIELLTVIIILALIALIVTPVIIGVLDKARKKAFEDSAYGVLDAGKLYYTNAMAAEEEFMGKIFDFGSTGNAKELKISGKMPQGGVIKIDGEGEIQMAIYDGVWCATKKPNEETITITEYQETTFILSEQSNIRDTDVAEEMIEMLK